MDPAVAIVMNTQDMWLLANEGTQIVIVTSKQVTNWLVKVVLVSNLGVKIHCK